MTKKDQKKRGDNLKTHGGFAEVAQYRKKGLDLRRADDRALKAFQDGVIADCGSLENMDTYQLAMLDRATECLIILRAMGEFVKRNGVLGKSGELTPCLRQSYVSYLNSFRLTLDSIYSRAGKKPSRRPNLKDLLQSTK